MLRLRQRPPLEQQTFYVRPQSLRDRFLLAKHQRIPTAFYKDTQTQATPSAFAASGFAALAASSTSPFGALGGSSAAAPSPFASAKAPSAEISEAQNSAPAANGGFGSFAKAPSSGFGTAQPSPFAAATSKASGTFGSSSIFGGGGFGGGFGGGSKLASFAAPTGDTKLGNSNGAIKPIGSPTHENDDNDGSESEGEGADDKSKDDEASEADDRFQHQDGKLCLGLPWCGLI